jgi:hypothetical protein
MREKGGERKESMKTIDSIKVSHFDANPKKSFKKYLYVSCLGEMGG